MFITPSFKKSLIVEQFQGNYLKSNKVVFNVSTEQIEETKRLQKESQSEVVFLKGTCTHACKTVCTYMHIHTKYLYSNFNSHLIIE